MEKMFAIDVVNGKPMLVSEGDSYDLSGRITIPSWDPRNPDWRWEIFNVHNDSISCALIVEEKPVFASRRMLLGKEGIGLILGGGKKFARSVNKSVYRYMVDHGITFLEPRVPTDASFYFNGAYTTVRVFDTFSEKECKPIAGCFTLDPQLPWLIKYIKIQGTRPSEWNALYVPGGYRFEEYEAKAEGSKYEAPEGDISHEVNHLLEEAGDDLLHAGQMFAELKSDAHAEADGPKDTNISVTNAPADQEVPISEAVYATATAGMTIGVDPAVAPESDDHITIVHSEPNTVVVEQSADEAIAGEMTDLKISGSSEVIPSVPAPIESTETAVPASTEPAVTEALPVEVIPATEEEQPVATEPDTGNAGIPIEVEGSESPALPSSDQEERVSSLS